GGPVVGRPGNMFYSLFAATDSRKRVNFNLNATASRTDEGYKSYGVFTGVNIRAASNVSFSVNPGYNFSRGARQYVNTYSDATNTAWYGKRYVFADLKQKTLSFDTRASITFTPVLTFELYAQPFISSVHFTRFKEFVAPRGQATRTYGEQVGTVVANHATDGRITSYTIDPDGAGPAAAFDQGNPDFNLRSLRGNAVLRW